MSDAPGQQGYRRRSYDVDSGPIVPNGGQSVGLRRQSETFSVSRRREPERFGVMPILVRVVLKIDVAAVLWAVVAISLLS